MFDDRLLTNVLKLMDSGYNLVATTDHQENTPDKDFREQNSFEL